MAEVGDIIREYQLEAFIGRGGMASVWKARHQLLDQVRAIKIMAEHLRDDPGFADRFRSEAVHMARLDHPNILGILEFFADRGRFCIVMPFVEGRSLELFLSLESPLENGRAIGMARSVLDALGYAHGRGLVHRDVKPSNILIDNGGKVLLSDFGIALAVGEERKTRVGSSIGTPQYMSPEQIFRPRLVDSRSDIYSFGCVLYEMLTGHTPFSYAEGESSQNVMFKHELEPVTPPSQWKPDLPSWLGQALLKALAKKPEERFSTCAEFAAALECPAPVRLVDTLPVRTPPPLPAPPPVPRASSAPQVRPVSPASQVPPPPAPLPAQPRPTVGPRRPAAPPGAKTPSKPAPAARSAWVVLTVAAAVLVTLTVVLVVLLRGKGEAPAPPSGGVTPAGLPQPPAGVPRTPGPTIGKPYTNSFGMVFLAIPPGTFTMGNEGQENEKPVHSVRLTALVWVQKTEVSVGQFRQFVQEAGYRTEAEKAGFAYQVQNDNWVRTDGLSWTRPGFEQTDECPVTCVTWNDAKAFATWLSKKEGRTYRLPTEAEWEYVARAGTADLWPFSGGEGGLTGYAWVRTNAEGRPHPIGRLLPNAWGLFDTLGNVWEWCADFYAESYSLVPPVDDPRGIAAGDKRTIRGGGWNDLPADAHPYTRWGIAPDCALNDTGFRLVLVP